jgi:hypothetical protein
MVIILHVIIVYFPVNPPPPKEPDKEPLTPSPNPKTEPVKEEESGKLNNNNPVQG